MYSPPYTITNKAINLIAEISAQIERYAIRLEQEDALRLRKANRIKTIHSSLAIEGNNLTENQVADIINGKNVVAPIKEIQEVKNAIATYELYPDLNPFNIKDLLKAHSIMMMALTDDAGHFRRQGVGVFSDTGCVHMAPPADRVPVLMSDLFEWLKEADAHLLIRSCVFHYEFEFIHPFSDGNGRIGRLWQSLILGRLHPIFQHLPVENLVYANQQGYYAAIAQSSAAADSGPFIDFMLGEILATLKSHQGDEINNSNLSAEEGRFNTLFGELSRIKLSLNDKKLILMLYDRPGLTTEEAAQTLGISSRAVAKQIKKFKDLGILIREGSRKGGLWKIISGQNS
ncbi:MAG: Fic family protein [Bacteroidales bacterium]|nr:Fic family protein [Bacteroidales bacterium]